MIPYSVIVAVDKKLGIGKNGVLPWHLPADLKYFKQITTSATAPGKINAVIMGRKTWESIPVRFRPLTGRLNIVISSQAHLKLPQEVVLADSFEGALRFLSKESGRVGEVFVIGGAQVFERAVLDPLCQKIYLTRIDKEFSCDRFFPDVFSSFKEASCSAPIFESQTAVRFCVYLRNA